MNYIYGIDYSLIIRIISFMYHEERIIQRYRVRDILNLLSTCKELQTLHADENMWRIICTPFHDFDEIQNNKEGTVSWKTTKNLYV